MNDIKNKINDEILKLRESLLSIKEADLNTFLSRLSMFNKKTAQSLKTVKIEDKNLLIEIAKSYFAKFPNKKIAVVGNTRMKIKATEKIFKEFGISSKNYEPLNEYLDNGKNGQQLATFYNDKVYAGILIGPMAHSINGKSGTGGSFFESPIPIVIVHIANKRPKITNKSLRMAITELLNKLS